MKLSPPFQFSPRDLPALKVGDTWVSLVMYDGKVEFIFDSPDWSWTDRTIGLAASGPNGKQQLFHACLSFLSAAADAYRWWMSTKRKSENFALYPIRIVEWAYYFSNEINMLTYELERNQNLIEEQ